MNQHQPSLRRSAAAAVGLLLLSGSSAVFGFQPVGVKRQGSHHPTTTLAVSTLLGEWDAIALSDFEEPPSMTMAARQQHEQRKVQQWLDEERTAQQRRHLSPALELPKHSVVVPEPTEMSSMEVTLGRMSMVAAFVLLANEVATGQSLPDQLIGVVTNCLVQ